MIKNTRNLNYILSFLRKLEADELSRYHRLFQYFFTDPTLKPRRLFELISDLLPQHDDEEILVEVCAKYEPGLIANLSTRIINVLHENLVLDVNLYKKGKFRQETQARVSVRKRLLQIRLMLQSGNTDKVSIYLDKTEAKAQRYEFFEELLELIRLRSEFLGYRKGASFLQQEHLRRRLMQSRLQALEKAREELDLLQSMLLSNHCPLQLGEQIRTSLSWIKRLPDLHRSSRLAWYAAYFKGLASYVQGDFIQGKDHLRSFLTKSEQRADLFGGKKIALIQWLQGMISLREGRPLQASEWGEKAMSNLTQGSVGWLLTRELLFRSYLISGVLRKARAALNDLIERGACDHLQQKYHLFAAALAFRAGDRIQAHQLLREQSSFRADVQGYNFFSRLLELMVAVEESNFDQADAVFQKLKRLWFHQKKKGGGNPRWELIIRILNQFNKIGFNRFLGRSQWTSWIEDLSTFNGILGWDSAGPEILPFHEWLEEDVLSMSV